jgi:hypothetical protein
LVPCVARGFIRCVFEPFDFVAEVGDADADALDRAHDVSSRFLTRLEVEDKAAVEVDRNESGEYSGDTRRNE